MKKYRRKHLLDKMKGLKPKKSIFKRRLFWIGILLLILLSSVFYLIFLFEGLQIQTIQVSGNEKNKTEDIQSFAWETLGFKNIFIVNTDTLKKNLLAGFVGIEDMKIEKELFESLHLQIIERKPVAIFCQDNDNKNCFFIDKNGVIYESTNTTDNYGFIVRPFDASRIKQIGQIAITKNNMDAMIKIQQNLKDNFQINVRQVFSSNPLVVTTTEGWKIYFDPETNIDLQISKMNTLLKNQISTSARKNLQYIYLQYKDRAYYK